MIGFVSFPSLSICAILEPTNKPGIRRRMERMRDDEHRNQARAAGFCLMRLPKQGDQIDVDQTSRMVDAFWRRVHLF